jgi:hypothetical protein
LSLTPRPGLPSCHCAQATSLPSNACVILLTQPVFIGLEESTQFIMQVRRRFRRALDRADGAWTCRCQRRDSTDVSSRRTNRACELGQLQPVPEQRVQLGRETALGVLREAVAREVNHIGNRRLLRLAHHQSAHSRSALHPYTDDLVVVIALTAGDTPDVSIDHRPRRNRRCQRHTAPPRGNCGGPLPV